MKNKASNSQFAFDTVGELNFIKHWFDTHFLTVDDLKFKTDLKLKLEPIKDEHCVSCFEFYFNYLCLRGCRTATYFKKSGDVLLSHNFGDNVLIIKRNETHVHRLFFFYKDGSSTFKFYKQYLTVCGFEGELKVLSFLNKIVDIHWVYHDTLFSFGGYYSFSIQGDKISKSFIENQIAKILKKDPDWLHLLNRIVKSYEIGQAAKQHISYARKVLTKGGKK